MNRIPVEVAWSESAAETAARIRNAPREAQEAVLSALRDVKGVFVWMDVRAALETA